MPSVQRGSVFKRGNSWSARYYDETGSRRTRGGFSSKGETREWLDAKVDAIAAVRRGDLRAIRRREMPTLGELVEEFVGQHSAEDSTLSSLRQRLRYALEGPGLDGQGGWRDIRLDRLQPYEIGAWRKHLPTRSAHGIHKALRQTLHYAVRAKLLDENPAALVANPEPKRTEVQTFTVQELEAAGAELARPYRSIPIFAGLTGLRPCEWIALERRDVDYAAGVVTVRRECVQGKVKPYGKTSRSLRAVPLPLRAAEALAEQPARLDAFSRCTRRAYRPRNVALARVVSGAPSGRRRKARALRASAHVRVLIDCGRRDAVRAFAVHGNVPGHARQDLRAPAPGRSRPRPQCARCVFGRGN
jgi:integrase